MSRVPTFVRENALSLFFAVLFLGSMVGQLFAGHADYNNQQIASGMATVSVAEYATSSDYAVDITENWQSEYLQFLVYVLAAVWLLQKGSAVSKAMGNEGRESDKEQKVGVFAQPDSPRLAAVGGWATRLYSRSLGLTMGLIFVGSWLAQSVAGWATYNEQRLMDLQDPLTWPHYLAAADFWARTVQNWQSEFLAVGSMAVFTIYLRERGSPQSKPVGEPHASTGVSG